MMTRETFTAMMELDREDALTALAELVSTEKEVEALEEECFDWADEMGLEEKWAWLMSRLYDMVYVEDLSDGDPWDE
jgi:hypothetical protein